MKLTTMGMCLLLLFLLYYLFLSTKLILIGVGIIRNPLTKIKKKDKAFLIRGIIGISVTFPFFCFIVFIFIQVFFI